MASLLHSAMEELGENQVKTTSVWMLKVKDGSLRTKGLLRTKYGLLAASSALWIGALLKMAGFCQQFIYNSYEKHLTPRSLQYTKSFLWCCCGEALAPPTSILFSMSHILLA